MMMRLGGAFLMTVALLAAAAPATTYYVDYDGGDDANAGTSPNQAFQHCPGDPAATGDAKATQPAAGDVIRFKGGVAYRGTIVVTRSGDPGHPIVYDGNTDGTYGRGRAVIDGSEPLADLTPCRSAEEARGNPTYRHLRWATVPKGARWGAINLCQGDTALAVAQDPNPSDTLFQERPADYVATDGTAVRTLTDLEVRYVSRHDEVGNRPLISMLDGSRHSAVIHGLDGEGAVEIALGEPVTVTALSITAQKGYGQPKTVAFVVAGEEVLRAELDHHPDRSVEQRFALDRPATFSTLVVRFLAAHPRRDGRPPAGWGAVQRIAAYDDDGTNVLHTTRTTVVTDPDYFTQDDPSYYDNALLALYASPARVYYKRILDYDPAAHRITVETLRHNEVPYDRGGAYAIVNSPRHIDRPGEYALVLDPEDDARHKVFVWPLPAEDGTPVEVSYSRRNAGFTVRRASHVTIRDFVIHRQGWTSGSGLSADGRGATGLTIRNVTVRNLRGRSAAIHVNRYSNVLIEDCAAIENAWHTKGILVRNSENVVVQGCRLHRNTSTALDYYTVTNGAVRGCRLTDNKGMHANGLTFYVGCRDILVEGNTVLRGNTALTCQDGDGLIIRNNILSGDRAVAFWAGKDFDNVVIANNLLLFTGRRGGTAAAIYSGNNGENLTIANNIVEGLSGNLLRRADIHHNIFTEYGPVLRPALLGDNHDLPDKDTVVRRVDDHTWTLAPDSPAIDAGADLGVITAVDITGVPREPYAPVDIGPWEHGAPRPPQPVRLDPETFTFTLGDHTFGPPMVQGTPGYTSVFTPVDGAEPVVVSALDFTDQAGGNAGKRLGLGFIMRWDDPGHWIEWTVDVPKAGPYELVIDHSSEMPSARQFILNGSPVGGLEEVRFHATGSWHAFDRTALPVALHLREGRNVLRVMNLGGSMNFRTLRFIPVVSSEPGPERIVESD
ncbi:MAG: right-handed parallel beta-helix repeat-containing protein [Planctomycetota bacterium]